MQKYADYIKQIEIESLWSGTKHILWNLDRRVNILSGVNGVGKSTILNKVIKGLAAGGEFPSHMIKGVHLQVEPEEADSHHVLIGTLTKSMLITWLMVKGHIRTVAQRNIHLLMVKSEYLDSRFLKSDR